MNPTRCPHPMISYYSQMAQHIQQDIRQLIKVFEQALDIRLPPMESILSTHEHYIQILEEIVPEYGDFYQQLRKEQNCTLQEKIQALLSFIEEEVVFQPVGLDAGAIANSNLPEILKFLKTLFEITNTLFEDEVSVEGSNHNAFSKQSVQNIKPKADSRQEGKQKSKKSKVNLESANSLKKVVRMLQKPPTQRGTKVNKKSDNADIAIQKSRSQYRNCLVSNLKQKDKIKTSRPKSTNSNLKHAVKAIEKQNIRIKVQAEQQQLRGFIELRDKKLKYISKIQGLIVDLEKEKMIDQKHQFIKLKQEQSNVTKNRLNSLDNAFNDQLQILKDNYAKARLKKEEDKFSQKQLMVVLEKQLKEAKTRETHRVKAQWESQRERLRQMMVEDEDFQNQIVEVYKKH